MSGVSGQGWVWTSYTGLLGAIPAANALYMAYSVAIESRLSCAAMETAGYLGESDTC